MNRGRKEVTQAIGKAAPEAMLSAKKLTGNPS